MLREKFLRSLPQDEEMVVIVCDVVAIIVVVCDVVVIVVIVCDVVA